jgi:hypothetical protein
VPYRIDLAALRPHELRRTLPPGTFLVARPVLAAARLIGRPVLAPDDFPDGIELADTVEEDWDNLGASQDHAVVAREMRDSLKELGAVQVGASRVVGLPFPRFLFAYTKVPDVFVSLFLSDASGPAPHLEMITLFREPRDGKVAIVSSSNATSEALDPSARLIWQAVPGAGVNGLFQAHRGRVNEFGESNRRAVSGEDFRGAFLTVANENYAAWRGRGVLRPAAGGR